MTDDRLEKPRALPRRLTGKVGRYLWCVLDRRGRMEYVGLAKWEADYMMSANNGAGRGWRRVRFVREEAP